MLGMETSISQSLTPEVEEARPTSSDSRSSSFFSRFLPGSQALPNSSLFFTAHLTKNYKTYSIFIIRRYGYLNFILLYNKDVLRR
jgi:hypothetical protein